MATVFVIYILVTGLLGLPWSLMSLLLFGVGYLLIGGASGVGVLPSEFLLWVMLAVAILNTWCVLKNLHTLWGAWRRRKRAAS